MPKRGLSCFALVIMIFFVLVPVTDGTAQQRGGGGNEENGQRVKTPLMLPLAAAGVGGNFSGTFLLERFAEQNGVIVAIGTANGTVTSSTGQIVTTGVQTSVVLRPVTVQRRTAMVAPASIMPASMTQGLEGRIMLAQATTCGILSITIGATNVDLLGLAVVTSPITVEVSGDTGGALGALVCAVLSAVTGVVGLLNQILGLLGGLTA